MNVCQDYPNSSGQSIEAAQVIITSFNIADNRPAKESQPEKKKSTRFEEIIKCKFLVLAILVAISIISLSTIIGVVVSQHLLSKEITPKALTNVCSNWYNQNDSSTNCDYLIPFGNFVRNYFPDWHNYTYDEQVTRIPGLIKNGGHDMYNGGNEISVFENESEIIASQYNRTYRFNNFAFGVFAFHPFIALLRVHQTNFSLNYTIQVTGKSGTDGNGTKHTWSNHIAIDGWHIDYHVFQISGTNNPSICEVYFLIYNNETSVKPKTFHLESFGDGTSNLSNSVSMIGQPENVTVVYMLLSRFFGTAVTEEDISRILTKYLGFYARDVDECKINNGGCSHTCHNSIGSYHCECYSKGFNLGEDNKTCFDVDECQPGNGGCEQICSNYQGSYRCKCPIGFSSEDNGKTCDATCGFIAVASEESQPLHSPKWQPLHYTYYYSYYWGQKIRTSGSRRCIWNIRTRRPGYKIRLKFMSFNIDSYHAYLKIYDPHDQPAKVTLSGYHAYPQPYLSSSNTIKLDLYVEVWKNGNGFKATFAEIP